MVPALMLSRASFQTRYNERDKRLTCVVLVKRTRGARGPVLAQISSIYVSLHVLVEKSLLVVQDT